MMKVIPTLLNIRLFLTSYLFIEKSVVWTTSLPLDRVHTAREEINRCYHHSSATIPLETLEGFDILLLASLIRLYLMELPECLFTFELYEPCKLLYANRKSISIYFNSPIFINTN